MSSIRPAMQFSRELFADAALALFIGIAAGLVIASLAAAGIITMTLAVILLALAWVVAVGGSFFGPRPFPHKHRLIFAIVLALILSGLAWYEADHYEKPLSAKEIADEVAKLIVASGSPPGATGGAAPQATSQSVPPPSAAAPVVSSSSTVVAQNAPALSHEEIAIRLELLRLLEERYLKQFQQQYSISVDLLNNWQREIKNEPEEYANTLSWTASTTKELLTGFDSFISGEHMKDYFSNVFFIQHESMNELPSSMTTLSETIKTLPKQLPTDYESGVIPKVGAVRASFPRVENWMGNVKVLIDTKRTDLNAMTMQ